MLKPAFQKAFKYYLILLAIYTAIYWPLIIIDDWGFVERYWSQNWAEYLGMWFAFYAVFLVGGSLYYWVPISLLILIFRKWLPALDAKAKKTHSSDIIDQSDIDD